MKPKKASPKESITRATLRLPTELWDRVQHRAIDEHVSASEIVSRALAAYMKGGQS